MQRDLEVRTENHSEFVENAKDWNGTRGLYFSRQKNISNLFQGWKNVTKWQRAAKVKTQAMNDEWISYMARRALIKLS